MAATKTITRNEFDRLCGDVKEIEEWKDGNGKPGAKATLLLLEERWCNMEKKIDKVFNALIALTVSVIGGLLIWFFTTIMPKISGQ